MRVSPCQAATIHHSARCPELRCHVCPGQMLKSYWGETPSSLLHDARPAGSPDHWPPVVRAPLVVTISDHSTVRSTVLSLPAHEPMIVRRPRPAQFRGYPTKIHSLSQSQALWNKAGILGMSLTDTKIRCSAAKKIMIWLKTHLLKVFAEQPDHCILRAFFWMSISSATTFLFKSYLFSLHLFYYDLNVRWMLILMMRQGSLAMDDAPEQSTFTGMWERFTALDFEPLTLWRDD